jgi:hypothetical protein
MKTTLGWAHLHSSRNWATPHSKPIGSLSACWSLKEQSQVQKSWERAQAMADRESSWSLWVDYF